MNLNNNFFESEQIIVHGNEYSIFEFVGYIIQHTVSFEVFRSLSEYEFATFYFDEKTCEIAMRT